MEFDDPGTVQFCLGGLVHQLNVPEFGVVLRLYMEEFMDDDDFDTLHRHIHMSSSNCWRALVPTSATYDSTHSKASALAPSLRFFYTTRVAKLRRDIELDKQVSKLALTVSNLESQGKLPSQTEPNPRYNVSVKTLRNGKVLKPVPGTSRAYDTSQDKEKLDTETSVESAPQKSFAVPPPFPGRLVQCKKEREEKEILDTFQKVEINIPFLNAINQIPRYAKFLKELCTNKRKLLNNEKASVRENVSAIRQRKIPPKCKDQGVIIQLADRSVVHPEGVLKDVLVKVNELIFPADFYIIDMEDDNSANYSDRLFGRPFLSIAQTKIDVRSGILTMQFDGEVVKFNVYEAMSRSSMISNVSNIDIIDPLTELHLEYHDKDELQTILCRSLDFDAIEELKEWITFEEFIHETVAHMEASQLRKNPSKFLKLSPSQTQLLPSVLQAPELELKPLPDHLK
ncbi:uncharacterized protein [Gossypium hirsutum]|uniref:Retrotransposon gag protein n=1 Tax=Gossypium hirsutum TaxID=3635 RepID=A0ABM3BJA6_GOSHI|nr:uncharacterized protein LOC121228077 [Gossypium hirsutum]